MHIQKSVTSEKKEEVNINTGSYLSMSKTFKNIDSYQFKKNMTALVINT